MSEIKTPPNWQRYADDVIDRVMALSCWRIMCDVAEMADGSVVPLVDNLQDVSKYWNLSITTGGESGEGWEFVGHDSRNCCLIMRRLIADCAKLWDVA